MGNEECAEAHGEPWQADEGLDGVAPGGEIVPVVEKGHEQKAHGNAGDDISVHHGDVVHGVEHIALPAAHGEKADGGEGAGKGGDDGRQQGHQQGGIHALHDEPVLEQLAVPRQGEALPHGAAVAGVEGEDNEQEDVDFIISMNVIAE